MTEHFRKEPFSSDLSHRELRAPVPVGRAAFREPVEAARDPRRVRCMPGMGGWQ